MKKQFKKMYRKNYVNPYLLFGSIFLVTLIFYSLKFSDLNVDLGVGILFFLVSAIALNFIFFILTKKSWARGIAQSVEFKEINIRLYFGIAILFLILGLVEVIYSGGMPLLGQSSYQSYGIPTIHVLLVSGNSFFILNIAKSLFLSKKNKKSLFFCFFIAILPLLFGLSRGTIVIVLVGILMLYISSTDKKLNLKKITVLLFVGIISMYVFGISGNYRINHDYMRHEDIRKSSLILSIGRENQNFEKTNIPTPFFWTYIYLTSPISNFHLNTQISSSETSTGITEYTVVNFCPDFISKRIYPSYRINYHPWQMTQEFTAASAFAIPYLMWGWGGVIVFLVYELLFPVVYFVLIKRFAIKYFDISIAIVSTMYLLMPFDNFFAFSALSIQLMFPFFCNLFRQNGSNKLV